MRAAIQEANDTFGPDTINFDIGGPASVKTISPTRPLPTITDPVTIDGYSQPGASANTRAEGNDAVLKVQLTGAEAGWRADGLQITAADSTVKGLVIGRFNRTGIRVAGPDATTGNSIEGNFVGIDPSGAQKAGNGGAGVRIREGAANVVGGADPAKRNVISGNGDCPNYGFGVSISSASGNFVQGNYIGTDRSGARALEDCRGISQFSGGVSIEGYRGRAANNTVGGTVGGVGNVISGNLYGIWSGGVGNASNKIEGNLIGTDASGTTNVGNGQAGVAIFNVASNNTVRGTASGAGNVISANDRDGVDVGAGSSGTEVEGNTIRDNGGNGVTIVGDHNTVGGMATGAENKIFDNEGNGVQIVGYTRQPHTLERNLRQRQARDRFGRLH